MAEAIAIVLLKLSALAIIFAAIVAFRVHLVFNASVRALDMTRSLAERARHYGVSPEKYYQKFEDYGSFDLLVFDLTKWTFRQLYPDIVKQFDEKMGPGGKEPSI